MRRKRIEKKYIILAILVFVILFLAFIFTIVKSDRNLGPLEQVIKDSVSFVSKVTYKPFSYVKKDKQNNPDIDMLKSKEKELESELKELKKLLNLNNSPTEYEYLNATVINRNVGYWYNTLTLDKGKTSGVKKDMIVVVANGLIGKVIKVSNFTSTVKLITNQDTTMPISVKINTGEKYVFGILNGYDMNKKRLIVEGISGNDKIQVGNEVVTTGLSDNSPSGILVGSVSKITTDNFDLARKVEIKSKVNFDDINYVTIMKKKEVKK